MWERDKPASSYQCSTLRQVQESNNCDDYDADEGDNDNDDNDTKITNDDDDCDGDDDKDEGTTDDVHVTVIPEIVTAWAHGTVMPLTQLSVCIIKYNMPYVC